MKLTKREILWQGTLKGTSLWGYTRITNKMIACIEGYNKNYFRLVVFKESQIWKDKSYKTLRGAKIAANRLHMELVKMIWLELSHHVTGQIGINYNIQGRTTKSKVKTGTLKF
jgi:hypothetical protein